MFKGGTALKKCYFDDYRFSEDLDFSAVGDVPTGEEMAGAIRQVCRAAAQLLSDYAPVEIDCQRYVEKEPHPGGQEAFTVRARFSWQRQPATRVMIETSLDERVIRPSQERRIIHEYGEPLEAKVQVYSLEEIVAEKLRAILQHIQKLEERGWSRSRARDYYDLWRILAACKNQMELANFAQFLQEKCAIRKVTFKSAEDFFSETMLQYVGKTWQQWLGPLVPGLPTFDLVISELRPQVAALLLTS
ncbi:MAG: nucleotidyl transferase AbiEii/AbiGii toxin family protein [Acidobacteria bacterium]|nr:nucleotidyl transferase AbiEii/AbiGii toxin family protein [Acidobacteriota bacterium]